MTDAQVLTQIIPQLFDLCDTIKQAAAHAANHPASLPAMRQDVITGIKAVEERAGQLNEQQTLRSSKMARVQKLDGKNLVQFVEDWYNKSMGPYLVEQFQQQLRNIKQFSQPEAKELADWILHRMPINPSGKRTLLLEVGMRCAAWAPEFSWSLMQQVLDTMPPEEQKECFPHWTGAPYRPNLHPQTQLEHCPICGGSGVPHHAALSGRMNNFDTLFMPVKLWMRCEGCGNLYSRYFPTEFLQMGSHPKVLTPTPHRMVTRTVQASSLHTWCNILNRIRSYTQGTSLMEVGVGQGHLIAVAQEMGYQVTAVELLEAEAQETADLLGLPVICGDFLHMEENLQVDIITMGDVIEHLQRPVEGLKKAHALLRDNGILWLSTPNFESSFSAMQKAFDPMWCEPYHISYFSRRGLLPILEQVGFELLEYTVSSRYNGSMELTLRKVPGKTSTNI